MKIRLLKSPKIALSSSTNYTKWMAGCKALKVVVFYIVGF